MQIAKGGTALDVMTAAADQNKKFNFQTTYTGNIGYDIVGIGDIKDGSDSWSFNYILPGMLKVKESPLKVSNIIIPGNDWEIIMRYEKGQLNKVI